MVKRQRRKKWKKPEWEKPATEKLEKRNEKKTNEGDVRTVKKNGGRRDRGCCRLWTQGQAWVGSRVPINI
jgi:hypothetical protein